MQKAHLSEQQLNEYLDGALAGRDPAWIETHLAGCAACRSLVEERRQLFVRLSSLAEERVPHDLTASVLSRIHPRRPLWQGVWGAGLVILLAAALLLLGRPLLPQAWAVLPDRIQGAISRAWLPLLEPLRAISIPALLRLLPHPRVSLSSGLLHGKPAFWYALGISATLLFFIGNLSLMRPGGQPAKDRRVHP